MKVTYRHLNHNKYDRFTLAVVLPDKVDLLNYVDSQFEEGVSALNLYLGVARCHPTDQYMKRIGRGVAERNTTETQFTFNSVHHREGRHLYNLHSWVRLGNYDYCVSLLLSTVPSSDFVKLEKASVA